MGLGMTHLSDDEDRRLNLPRPRSVIDELFGRRHCQTGSNRQPSSRTHSKHSTPLHRAPFPLSNPKSHLSRASSKPKPCRLLSKSPNLSSLPPPSRLPRCSLTGKNKSKGSGLPCMRNGQRSANDSRLRGRNGSRR
ncbi:hypothetical protein PILCRDRAFT_191907 [Piloderma croceum F 1598]|uniref:Uncharacterized protein n=1 Tax=Piloderma croceum (strain F 1598) TaxID=765440 RepID=A0A0C3G0C6_PILCF|nr:hypothetical protein PILCRDRAFT_191907 [Piloderma croceum F 1598]